MPPPRKRSRPACWPIFALTTPVKLARWRSIAVYATIAAVETFVDRHYAEQIAHLHVAPGPPGLRDTLLACQADECAHRDEAAALAPAHAGVPLRMWCRLVSAGSSAAVALARRF